MRRCRPLLALLGTGALFLVTGGLGSPNGAQGAVSHLVPAPGFWLVSSDGGVFAFGSAPYLGSGVNAPDKQYTGANFVSIVRNPGAGYCIGNAEAGSNEFGGASCGQAECQVTCASPAVAMGVAIGGEAGFAYADGAVHPAVPGAGNALGVSSYPIVGFAYTPDQLGYWEVASDGGVFSFGDAAFFGSLGGLHLVAPIVGVATTSDGKGYWLVASDGGVFAFGDARYEGSMGGHPLNAPVVGIAPSSTGYGYWLAAKDGGIFSFGDAPYLGSAANLGLAAPITGIASSN